MRFNISSPMLRHTIGGILVIVVAGMIGATAPSRDGLGSTTAPAAAPAPSPLTLAPTPQLVDKGCLGGRDDRSSELCAQWKAVDAARDSATWAERAFWAGGVSLLLLLVTLWQTRRAIVETRRIGQEQTRAYVSVNAIEVEIREDPEFGLKAPRPTLTISNAGGTPACNVSYFCGAAHIRVGEQDAFRCPDALPHLRRVPNIPANASQTIEGYIYAILPVIAEVDELFKAVTQNTPIGQMPCVVVWGAVLYDDVFQQNFRSDFAFLLDAHAVPERRALNLVQTGPVEVGNARDRARGDRRIRTYQPLHSNRTR